MIRSKSNARLQKITALNDRARDISKLGEWEQALSLCLEAIKRFGDDTNPEIRDQIARAFYNTVTTLRTLNRFEQSDAILQEMRQRFGAATTSLARLSFARALAGHGKSLIDRGRTNDAMAILTEIESRFAADRDEQIQELLAKVRGSSVSLEEEVEALFKQLDTWTATGDLERAAEVCEQILEKIGDRTEAMWQPQICRALMEYAAALAQTRREAKAEGVWTEVMRRFSENTESSIQALVCKAMCFKAQMLDFSERAEEAERLYAQIAERFADCSDIATRNDAVQAIVNRACILESLGRLKESRDLNDEVVRRWSHASEPSLQAQAAKALLNKGITYRGMGEHKKEFKVYEQIFRTFGKNKAPEVQESVVQAYLQKYSAQNKALLNPREALKTIAKFLKRYRSVPHPYAQLGCSQMMVFKSRILMEEGRYEDAVAACRDVIQFCKSWNGAEVPQIEMAMAQRLVWAYNALHQPEQAMLVRFGFFAKYAVPPHSPLRDEADNWFFGQVAELHRSGYDEDAKRHYQKFCETYETTTDPALEFAVGFALMQLGRMAEQDEGRQRAISYYKQAKSFLTEPGDEQLEDALALLEECNEVLRTLGAADDSPAIKNSTLANGEATARTRHTVSNAKELIATVRKAKANDIIILQKGRYVLTSPLIINKSLGLGGAGAKTTEVISTAPECAIRFEGDGAWMLQDLKFRYADTAPPGTLIEVEGGTLKMRRCTIEGAKFGSGLDLSGAKTAFVHDCRFHENAVGLLSFGAAEVHLEKNCFERNAIAGANLGGETMGVVRGNEYSDHHHAGILLSDEAAVDVEDNLCYRANFGIVFQHDAKGTASHNRCISNMVGIGITDAAAPELDQNQCDLNSNFGIVYNEVASGMAEGNTCQSNGDSEEDNIRIFPHARPLLTANCTTGESDEDDALHTEEFFRRQVTQLYTYMQIQSELKLDSLVPGRQMPASSRSSLPQAISDPELILAAFFADKTGLAGDNSREAFIKEVLPKWIEIYKRIVARGEVYL